MKSYFLPVIDNKVWSWTGAHLGQSQLLLRGPLDHHGDHSQVGVRRFGVPLVVLLLPAAAFLLLAAPRVPADGSVRARWSRGCGFIHEGRGTGVLGNHQSWVVVPVLDRGAALNTAGSESLRISVEVKVMVEMLSKVGRSGWCQDALLRPVLCHADQPAGARWGGWGPQSRSLTPSRLLAPAWLCLKSKQLTV